MGIKIMNKKLQVLLLVAVFFFANQLVAKTIVAQGDTMPQTFSLPEGIISDSQAKELDRQFAALIDLHNVEPGTAISKYNGVRQPNRDSINLHGYGAISAAKKKELRASLQEMIKDHNRRIRQAQKDSKQQQQQLKQQQQMNKDLQNQQAQQQQMLQDMQGQQAQQQMMQQQMMIQQQQQMILQNPQMQQQMIMMLMQHPGVQQVLAQNPDIMPLVQQNPDKFRELAMRVYEQAPMLPQQNPPAFVAQVIQLYRQDLQKQQTEKQQKQQELLEQKQREEKRRLEREQREKEAAPQNVRGTQKS